MLAVFVDVGVCGELEKNPMIFVKTQSQLQQWLRHPVANQAIKLVEEPVAQAPPHFEPIVPN